ncbi:MAG TPA: cysteine hydrolase family protein [Dongiaceae bacterium]|jgi:nicotinamidase-related amidase
MTANTALLIVDLQVAMFESESEPPIHDAHGLLGRAADLIARARSAGVPVIYVRHDGGPGDPLEAGRPGWDIHPMLEPAPEETIVEKAQPDSFQDTDLGDRLSDLGIGKLIIAGAQTDYCINATCRRAAALGYDTTLVADTHSTWGSGGKTAPEIIAAYNAELGGLGVRLAESRSVTF